MQNQDFSGKMANFEAFWNFTDVRFAAFSVLTGVSFGENEISTDVRFRAFFWRQKRTRGVKKKKNSRLRRRGVFFTPPQHVGVRFRGFSNPTGVRFWGVSISTGVGFWG